MPTRLWRVRDGRRPALLPSLPCRGGDQRLAANHPIDVNELPVIRAFPRRRLADTYLNLFRLGLRQAAEATAKATPGATRALELHDRLRQRTT